MPSTVLLCEYYSIIPLILYFIRYTYMPRKQM